MGHANGIITAPVNTDDISATLGVASHDVATLCISQKVNKRSRFKPYPIGSYNTELTDELLRQNNFCMRPACVEHVYGGNVGDYRAMPWKQWTRRKLDSTGCVCLISTGIIISPKGVYIPHVYRQTIRTETAG